MEGSLSTHGAEHEALLVAVLTGERASTDAQVQRVSAACAVCARELRELTNLQRGLELDAADEARALSELAAARAAAGAVRAPRLVSAATDGAELPGSAEVEAFLRERLAPARAAPRPWRRRTLVAALAAAAVAALGVAWWASEHARSEPDVALGAHDLVLVAPLGDVASFDVFEWRSELDPNGWFELSIYAAAAPPGAAPLVGPLRVRETRYALGSRTLPSAIRWEIERFDSSLASVSSAAGSARLSSH